MSSSYFGWWRAAALCVALPADLYWAMLEYGRLEPQSVDFRAVDLPAANGLEQRYRALLESRRSAPLAKDSPERRELSLIEAELLQRFLNREPLYLELRRDLGASAVNTAAAVELLREELWRERPVESAAVQICTSEQDLEAARRSELQNGEPAFVRWSWPESSPIEINRLYHWAPADAVAQILDQGLLPGFLLGQSTRGFVFAALEPNQMWAAAARSGRSFPLDYPRAGRLPKDYVQLEIDYDPELEACLWLGYYSSFAGSDELRRETLYHSRICLSSKMRPLAEQVGDLLAHDRSRLPRADRRADEAACDPWRHSPFFGCDVPRWLCSDPGIFEHSEVLLNYVEPERIKIFDSGR